MDNFRMHLHVGTGGDFDFNPQQGVYLFVDPGYQTAYAVLAAQKRGEHLWVVDEVFEKSLTTSDIIKVCQQRPWWSKVIGGAIDVAGTQHQGMPAPSEVWAAEGGVALRSQRILIRDSIERVKTLLNVNPVTAQPLIHINGKCQGLISEMGGCTNPLSSTYQPWKWRMDRDGYIVGDAPEDKNNHSCKALAYGIVDLYGYTTTRNKIKVKFI